MPVSINMPQRQQQVDPLEKLAAAVNVAKTIYGINIDSKQLELAKQKLSNEQDLLKQKELKDSTLSDNEIATGGYEVSEGPKEGFNKAFILPRGEQTPVLKYIKKPVAGLIDPYGLKELEATSKKLNIQEKQREAVNAQKSPIAGYDKIDNLSIDPTSARQLKGAAAATQKFNAGIDDLIKTVSGASPAELANPLSNTSKGIKNKLRDLQLTYKGDDFAKLGVLAGPDLKLLEEVIENPGTLSNLISGKEGVLARYQDVKDRVNRSFDVKAQSFGLTKNQGPGKIKVSNGKETLLIDASDLTDAENDGYKKVP